MKNAFNKEIARSIRQSAGRFAAIAIISLLGAGFYAGLRMAAPDMRLQGDEFFDGGNLYDISVMTTLGIDDGILEMLDAVEGVVAVMPAHRVDAMVLVGEGSHAASVESLSGSAAGSDTSDGLNALSDDTGYLNRPVLVEGAWPVTPDECVVGIDSAREMGIAIGDEIVVESVAASDDVEGDGEGDGEDSATFTVSAFTVTGFVNSAAYAQSSQLGVTSLGTGAVELYAYVPEAAFAEDLPYAVAYLAVAGAKDLQWGSAAYDKAVAVVEERLDALADKMGIVRWNAVRADAQQELDGARADYERERADVVAQLNDAAAQLADARVQLDSAAAELAQGKSELDDSAALLTSTFVQLEEGDRDYEAGVAMLAEKEAELAPGRAQLDSLKAALENPLLPAEQRAVIEAQVAQIEEGVAQLEAAKAQLAASRAQLDVGWAQYQDGVRQYEEGLAQYESGRAEYESGRTEYESGLTEYEANRADAEEAFAEAEAELADAQADIDAIERPGVYVIDRAKNYGAAALASDADGITQIATFLPFMFFLVAALVSLTSMTRMVDEERLEIGTHKALGYGKARITSKYLIYGVAASGIGSVIGVVTLGKLLPWFILTSYQVTYAMPNVPLPIDAGVAARAIGLSVGVTALATWGAAAASLRARPAELMLPRVPKAGKRIFLERVKPLWKRLSFSHKVTARNLLRYKRRFFMAVVGIAGCTALLMIGFGLRDAIGGIVSSQYEELVNYDVAVRMGDDLPDESRAAIDAALESPDVEDFLAVDDFNLVAEGPDDDLRIEVVVPSDADRLDEFVTLRDRVSGTPLLPGDGQIILTEKAADTLGLVVGDAVVFFDEDAVGDKTGDGRSFTVGGIAENYLGHYAYLLPGGYRSAFGEEPAYDLLYVKLADGADTAAFSDALLSIDGVDTVSFVAEKITTYEDMLDVMNKLIYVIMLLSAALAFVVLYNLTNINITERVREIATLKVLGFTRHETNVYIFREVIIMALIGALVGCIIGAPLTFYIAAAAETPQMMFGRTIEPASYVLSFVITMAFSAIVAFTMRGKLARVNMVESLKSVE